MAKFAVYTVVHEGFTAHYFKPGDEVPEWAINQVGAHVLEAEQAAEEVPDFTADRTEAVPEVPAVADDDSKVDESEEEEAEPEAAPDPAAEEVPDFTAPAPVRRNSRTRKS